MRRSSPRAGHCGRRGRRAMPLAFKITTPADLERARALVAQHPLAPRLTARPAPAAGLPRVGVGTDVHAFGGDGTLWLAGLEWPGEPALSGHSDGDAVAHAIVDALLSAAGLGDIGTHFGTDHPEYAGAHADVFLAPHRRAARRGRAGASATSRCRCRRTVRASRPAAPRPRRCCRAALGGAPVSVSATTTDGLGFTGRGEGVSAFAMALVVPRLSASERRGS